VARYFLSGAVTTGDFPAGTLVVNVLGSFVIGVLIFGGAAGGWLTQEHRVFLAIGVLGGFTTMSSFSYETLAFLEDGAIRDAVLNVFLMVGSCLAATWLGRAVGLAVWAGGA
jgi:CrcB protein